MKNKAGGCREEAAVGPTLRNLLCYMGPLGNFKKSSVGNFMRQIKQRGPLMLQIQSLFVFLHTQAPLFYLEFIWLPPNSWDPPFKIWFEFRSQVLVRNLIAALCSLVRWMIDFFIQNNNFLGLHCSLRLLLSCVWLLGLQCYCCVYFQFDVNGSRLESNNISNICNAHLQIIWSDWTW